MWTATRLALILIDPGQNGTPGNDNEDQLQPGGYLGKSLPFQVNTIDSIAEKVSLADGQQSQPKILRGSLESVKNGKSR